MAAAQGIDVNGGVLTWTLTETTRSCYNTIGEDTLYYPFYAFYPITLTVGGVAYPLGSAAYWQAIPNCKLAGSPASDNFTYSPPGEQCTIDFVPGPGSASATGSCTPAYSGMINPKYLVIGVEYAPPGNSSTVLYTENTVTGSSVTSGTSFGNKTTMTVALSAAPSIPGVSNAKETTTLSQSYQQQSGSSTQTQISQTATAKTGMNGYTDPTNGVNHNFDYIFVWLNPVATYTASQGASGINYIQFTGFGFDLTDPNSPDDMDVIGIPLGCITGWLQQNFPGTWGGAGGTCADVANYYSRTWALTNADGSGPGLSEADLQQILAADPFSNPDYVPTVTSGYTTTDGRFTLCNQPLCDEDAYFEPNLTYGFSQGYSTNTVATQNYSHTETFSVEEAVSVEFLSIWSASLNTQNETTWTYSSSNAVNNSNGQTAAFTLVGPPAGYDGPLEFTVFQDNYYGTFMFFP